MGRNRYSLVGNVYKLLLMFGKLKCLRRERGRGIRQLQTLKADRVLDPQTDLNLSIDYFVFNLLSRPTLFETIDLTQRLRSSNNGIILSNYSFNIINTKS